MKKGCFLVFILMLCFCPMSFGQTTFGKLAGTVTDVSGASVPSANVILTNLGTSGKLTVVTGSAGGYQFVNLAPGEYRIDAEVAGFKHFTRQPVVIEVNQTTSIDITLQLGLVTQVVEVTAPTPLLQAETSSLGQVIGTREANELPLNGRNAMNLVALAPSVIPQGSSQGTVTGVNNFAWGNYQMGGAAANQGAEYLDGAPLRNSLTNCLTLVPTQDSLQEFKVQTNNLDAQWGRFAGGVINFTTKSGSNAIHGAAYEYLRNTVLNANDFFSNATGLKKTPFVQNQFGANAGGPLVIPGLYDGRNKTFWFASYEGYRERITTPYATVLPTAAERNGDYSSLLTSLGSVSGQLYDPTTTNTTTGNSRTPFVGNIIPSSRFNPTSLAMLNYLPMPNMPGLTNQSVVNNWAGTGVKGGDNDQLVIRADKNVSDKQRISARYNYFTSLSLAVDPFKTGYCVSECQEKFRTQNAMFDDVYNFNPTTVLNMMVTLNRFAYNRTPKTVGFDLSLLGPNYAPLKNDFPTDSMPTVTFNNQYNNGGIESSQGATSTIVDATTTPRIAGSLIKMKGRHTIQFGGEYRSDTENYVSTGAYLGVFSFSNAFTSSNPNSGLGGDGTASFLLGYPSKLATQSNPAPIAALQSYMALYLQDQFRATKKLTLNYGARWEKTGPFTERFNRISVLEPNAATAVKAGCTTIPAAAQTGPLAGQSQLCMPNVGDLGLVATPQNPNRYSSINPWRQWSPHVGFAYKVENKTVIRGGYGIFWISPDVTGREPANDFIDAIATPLVTSVDGGYTPCQTPGPTGCTPTLSNTFNLYNPFPSGILASPGRSPIYQTLAYGSGIIAGYVPDPAAYYTQWNVDVQRELPGGTLIDVAYAGAKGTHLPDSTQSLDILPDKYLSLGNNLLTKVPNPYYGLFQTGNPIITNHTALNTSPTVALETLLTPYPQYSSYSIASSGWNSSNYQSMQFKLEKRMKGHGTLLVAYTVSKTMTSGDGDDITSWLEASRPGGIQNWNNRTLEKSLLSYDVPQRLVASYILDLPVGKGKRFLGNAGGVGGKLISGWGVQGITVYQRGFPLEIAGGGTSIGTGNSQRPTRIGTGSGKLSGSVDSRLGGTYGPNRWFDTSIFGYTQAWTYGTESRTDPVLRADGVENWDFSMVKDTSFGPENKLNLQFRAEFFNIFNRTQFGPPNASCCSNPTQPSYNAAFGTITSDINTPRLIQFALRFTF